MLKYLPLMGDCGFTVGHGCFLPQKVDTNIPVGTGINGDKQGWMKDLLIALSSEKDASAFHLFAQFFFPSKTPITKNILRLTF